MTMIVEPSIYLFCEKEDNYELYLGEYSTAQGLLLFDDNQKLVVRSANGSDSNISSDWITEKNFENFKNVKQVS